MTSPQFTVPLNVEVIPPVQSLASAAETEVILSTAPANVITAPVGLAASFVVSIKVS